MGVLRDLLDGRLDLDSVADVCIPPSLSGDPDAVNSHASSRLLSGSSATARRRLCGSSAPSRV